MLICKSIFPQQRLTVNTELGKSKHKFRFMLQITYFVQQKGLRLQIFLIKKIIKCSPLCRTQAATTSGYWRAGNEKYLSQDDR